MKAAYGQAVPPLLLAVATLLAGCGRSSGLRSNSTAGGTATVGSSYAGGNSNIGGVWASGGSVQGGATPFLTGGDAQGGTSLSISGGSRTGGGSASGGLSSSGGSGSRGGVIQSGGTASGGTRTDGVAGITAGGAGTTGTASGGTTGTSSSSSSRPDGGAGDGGILGTDFCTGTLTKIVYKHQVLPVVATNYQSALAFDCCNSYGVNLHTDAVYGFDVQIEVMTGVGLKAGDYDTASKVFDVRAPVRTSSQASMPPVYNSSGRVRLISTPSATSAWELGLCLEVGATDPALPGTWIYVPTVTMMPSSQWNNRWQVYLLQDRTLGPDTARTATLDSLVLSAQPLLDLSRIAYVEQSTTRIGLNPGQKLGDWLVTLLGHPTGLPFVLVADGVRIYVGTFTAGLSSIPPVGPWLEVETIKPDDFVLQAPWTGEDPRNDARILKVLKETGKLVP
jgi:hypothetical protein